MISPEGGPSLGLASGKIVNAPATARMESASLMAEFARQLKDIDPAAAGKLQSLGISNMKEALSKSSRVFSDQTYKATFGDLREVNPTEFDKRVPSRLTPTKLDE